MATRPSVDECRNEGAGTVRRWVAASESRGIQLTAKAATLKDVAREAGVHISTASRALNEATRSELSTKTAERVIAAAERLGYRPHPLARGLRTNRTLSVGMVVPDLISPFIPPILAGAQRILSGGGYSLLIGSDDGNSPRTNSAIDTFPAIVGDDYAALSLVVRHLVQLGHTRIAHVAGPLDISTGLYRRDGFVTAVTDQGLDSSDWAVYEAGSFRLEDGHAACAGLLDSGNGYTAIVAANDLLALGCIDAVREKGLSVPADVSVTGYDDIALVDRLDPALTTISLPYEEMGTVAGRLLLDLLVADDRAVEAPTEPIRLAPTLVVRSSTGPVGSK
jgi:LacI family transcriptional regulator